MPNAPFRAARHPGSLRLRPALPSSRTTADSQHSLIHVAIAPSEFLLCSKEIGYVDCDWRLERAACAAHQLRVTVPTSDSRGVPASAAVLREEAPQTARATKITTPTT